MKHGPWTSGPRELLDHAKDHLAKGTDVDNRFAMISVDNAVELMLKTYLILPKRVTGLSLTRKQTEEYTRDFPTALSRVEELVPERVSGVPLGEIEWFHRVRNQLYHEGNAITVERDKVQRYLEHAESLMRRLFLPGAAASGTRRKLTEQKFLELLSETTGRRELAVARKLLTDLRRMNVAIRWGAAGFSARLPTPHLTTWLLTLLVLEKGGTAYVGWLATQLERVDLPRAIARDYYERAAALFDNCAVKTQPSGDLGWTRSIRLSELEEVYQEFMAILADAIDRIKSASESHSQEPV